MTGFPCCSRFWQHCFCPNVELLQVAAMRPRFVPLDGVEGEGKTATPAPDTFSGITQRRLQNGIRINYRWAQKSKGKGKKCTRVGLVMHACKAIDLSTTVLLII
jgi:hypothetical protein